MEFSEIPGHQGLFRFQLTGVLCLPGAIHLRRWGLTKGKQEPFLGSNTLDAVAARVLYPTHERFLDQSTKTDQLTWIGITLDRLLEDNTLLDETMDPDQLREAVGRLCEEDYLAQGHQDNMPIYFPTAKLIQRILDLRFRPSPNWREIR